MSNDDGMKPDDHVEPDDHLGPGGHVEPDGHLEPGGQRAASAGEVDLASLVEGLQLAARDEDIVARIRELAGLQGRAVAAISQLALPAASKRLGIADEALAALEAISVDWQRSPELAASFPTLLAELKRLDFDRAVTLFRSQPNHALRGLVAGLDGCVDDIHLTLVLQAIAQVLAMTPDPSVSADDLAMRIEYALLAEQVHVRRAAVIALANLGYCTSQGTQSLSRMMLDEPDLGVRQQVVRAVGKLLRNQDDSAQLLVWRLADTDEDVATEAAAALLGMGALAVPALSNLLERTASLRDLQQQTTQRFCREMEISIHRVILEDVWEIAECRIVDVLASLGATAAPSIPALLNKSKSKDLGLRVAVAKALGAIGVASPGVTERLVRMLVDGDVEVRSNALRALQKAKSPWTERSDFRDLVAANLVPRLDRSAEIEFVSKTLCSLGEAVVPILTDREAGVGLYDANSRIIREHCAKILGVIGKTCPDATKTLIQEQLGMVAEDEAEHGFVRKAAQLMLDKLAK